MSHNFEYDEQVSHEEQQFYLYDKLEDAMLPRAFYNTYYLGHAKQPYGLKLSIPSGGNSWVDSEIEELASKWRAFGNRMYFYESNGVSKDQAKALTDHMLPNSGDLSELEEKVELATEYEDIGKGLKAPAEKAFELGKFVGANILPIGLFIVGGIVLFKFAN